MSLHQGATKPSTPNHNGCLDDEGFRSIATQLFSGEEDLSSNQVRILRNHFRSCAECKAYAKDLVRKAVSVEAGPALIEQEIESLHISVPPAFRPDLQVVGWETLRPRDQARVL